jgi:hypothetical protein
LIVTTSGETSALLLRPLIIVVFFLDCASIWLFKAPYCLVVGETLLRIGFEPAGMFAPVPIL